MDFQNVVVVTNRTICAKYNKTEHLTDPLLLLLDQLEKLADTKAEFIILREKDLPEKDYENLAGQALRICEKTGKKLILHSYFDAAKNLSHPYLHLPLGKLEALAGTATLPAADFKMLGVSVHSLNEAKRAEALGATYLVAGHIFETDCKKNLPGRGLSFLREICDNVRLPVYAIGGICEDNLSAVLAAGAAGGCMMSEAMKKLPHGR